MGNTLLMTQLLLATVQQAVQLSAVLNRAAAEGRDVTDAEIDLMRAGAVAATDALAAPEATQRGGGGGPKEPL